MKIEEILTPFKVGVLIILGGIATVFMVTWLAGDMRLREDETIKYYAIFDDVTGLAVRSRIQLAGISVGTVERISLVGERARVDIAVRKDIVLYRGIPENGYYRNGATIAKKQASLIGDYYLDITPGADGPPLRNGDEIGNVMSAIGPERLFEQLSQITDDIQQVTESLATVFGGEEAQRNVQEMMRNVQNILATLDRFVEENRTRMDDIVADASVISRDIRRLSREGTASIESILRDSEAIVQEVRFIVGQSTTDVQAGLGTLQGTLGRLQRTLDSLNYSLQNVQDITEKINEGEGTVGELINNPAIAYRTEQILDNAGDFIGRLTRLRTLVELRTEFHLAHRQMKNVFGLRLEPNPYKFYALEFIDDFRGTTSVVTERVNTTDAGAPDGLYQETRVTTTDQFKLSLIFGRGFDLTPWMMLSGRFGIIESSGGFGGNVILFPDRRLDVQMDLFDFGSAPNPRLRAFATYRFFEFAYISAGIDDAINDRHRDYFLGAGIRFDDEDLKAILTTTGVPTTGR